MTADVEPGPPGLSIAGARATITLRRPAHRNRLHREDLHALQSHLRRIAADDALRVLVLTGQGPAFCAGFHLGQLGQPDAAGTDPQLFEHTVDALAALALPTVARLNGGIHGGATDLALACDFRIGVAGLTLRMPAARLGLHYYPGGLQRAVARLGLQAAKRLFLLAEPVDDAELLRIGYLDALVGPAQLDAAVDALCASLQAGAPLALRGMKASLEEIARGGTEPARLRERVARCADSADLREGLAALAERRTPQFLGR
ncbi:MAG: enoyl-CoA hydratase/isomerase family protein [Burkholderiales bacterium]|nr:enoyl-CoA hydratase/isomerase family protein [Burkholderiales bacterium]